MPMFQALLSLPYLRCSKQIPIRVYQIQEKCCYLKIILFFLKEKQQQGIGGPHAGMDMIWPLSIIMRGLTSTSDNRNKSMYSDCCRKHMAVPVLCTNLFIKMILKILPENGLPGPILCLANCYGKCIRKSRIC